MRIRAVKLSRRRVLLGAALLAAVAWGGWYGYWSLVEHRFHVVTDGRLYQSAAMPPDTLADVVREHGIRTVVDLRYDDEGDIEGERRSMKAAGARYVHLASAQQPEQATIDAFLEIASREENQPILVHCEHGEGRSVLFAALYRIEIEGWENDRARRACRILPWRGTFAPGGEKGRYLLGYRPHLRADPSR